MHAATKKSSHTYEYARRPRNYYKIFISQQPVEHTKIREDAQNRNTQCRNSEHFHKKVLLLLLVSICRRSISCQRQRTTCRKRADGSDMRNRCNRGCQLHLIHTAKLLSNMRYCRQQRSITTPLLLWDLPPAL